jgi:two-component system, OmpR family, phosphate regulon sensor histidine kinase PhoR
MATWFGRKFSRRLAVAFCLTSLAVVFGTSFLVGRFFQKTLLDELTQSLTTTAATVEAQTDKTLFVRRDAARLEALSQFLSQRSGARISFIAADGVVLGDSAVRMEALGSLENHGDRPEVHTALSGARGGNVRQSHTTGERFVYVAVPSLLDGRVVGVVRGAYPLKKIEDKIARLRHQTIMLSVAVLVIAFFIALWLASSLSRPVREMSEVAQRIAGGDYLSRVRHEGADEHGRLGEALNFLAERVHRTVQELSHGKAQLSGILENMMEGVVALDAAGRVIAINPALARVFSLDAAGTRGKLFLEVLRHHQLDQLVRGVFSDHKARVEEVRTFVPEERIFEAQAAPLHEGGEFAGALVVLHDITRLRQLEQVRRDFVANVSHELRTPLASIKGFAETLEMGALDDPKNARGFLESIVRQTDRMTALVEDLLDLTAIESGERAPVIEPVAVGDVLDDVVSSLRPQAGRKKIDIVVNVPRGLPPVAADRGQLRQIFVNLLENAVKFTQAGSVTVTAAAAGDRLSVTVADTGVGIPAQDLGRIFERFYRVDKARSREMGGTGLGLAIVKHLVESHGGSVHVESSVNRGSTFTVLLPFHKSPPP